MTDERPGLQPPILPPDQPGEPMPLALKLISWLVLGALFVGIYAASDAFTEYTPAEAVGAMAFPLAAAALMWRFVGRRGGRKADFTSPAVIAIAIGIALLSRGENLVNRTQTSEASAPTSQELAERFVDVPGSSYREPIPAEEKAFRDAAGELDKYWEAYQFRFLQEGAEDSVVVVLASVHPDDADAIGFERSVAVGMASESGGEVDEIEVADETAYLTEQPGESGLVLVDEEDGVVVMLFGPEDECRRAAEHFAGAF